jgi:hypothetical protein
MAKNNSTHCDGLMAVLVAAEAPLAASRAPLRNTPLVVAERCGRYGQERQWVRVVAALVCLTIRCRSDHASVLVLGSWPSIGGRVVLV